MSNKEIKKRKEFICSAHKMVLSLDDETFFYERWLYLVEDGMLDMDSTWEDVDDFYTNDETFNEVMKLFIDIIKEALDENGGKVENLFWNC